MRIPGLNSSFSSEKRWDTTDFIYKMKNGTSEPFYEKYIFKLIGLERIER